MLPCIPRRGIQSSHMASFELWDRQSQNLIGEFPSQDEALAFVLALVEQDGELAGAALSLSQTTERGTMPIASSGQLLELAGVVRAA